MAAAGIAVAVSPHTPQIPRAAPLPSGPGLYVVSIGTTWRRVVKRRVEFSPDAVRQLRALRANDRGLVKEQIREQLGESQATQETRNRFRLRRPSRVADYELRIRDWRVFYRVVDATVQVALIGRKSGNFLIIDRKRFIL